MRGPGAPVVAAALAVSTLVAACGVVPSLERGNDVVPGRLADRPSDPDAVQPFIDVARGVGPRGAYRAWVYRTSTGMTCLEVAETMSGTSSCDGDANGLAAIGWSNDSSVGITLTGGTQAAGATTARVRLRSGDTADFALAHPGGGIVPASLSVYVIPLPKGAVPVELEILDSLGTTLETQEIVGAQ